MTILLLDIPGLNLAYLGCYGNDWVATPNLDRLAGECVLFDRHHAGCPGDLTSGRYCFPRLTPSMPPPVPGRNWFQGDETPCDFRQIAADEAATLDERFSQVLHAIVAALKKKPRSEKRLLWAEFPSLAPPWSLPLDMLDAYFDDDGGLEAWLDPPPQLPPGDEHFDRLQFTYAAVVTFVDAQIGWLVDKLSRGGGLERMLLVITSSRALPLAEHGWVGYQRAWQHQENVHLPLLMRLPQRQEAGTRFAALTQPVDVVPTLIEHLGLPPPALPGKSLWPLIRSEKTEVREHACSGERIGATRGVGRCGRWNGPICCRSPVQPAIRCASRNSM